MSNQERTYIMIKPDGVQRGLTGEIIKRFENRGYFLTALKMKMPTTALLEQHYADLSSKKFFPGLIKYMAQGPVVCMVWTGLNAVKGGRMMLGETNPQDSKPGSIRGDFCVQTGRNIIHGSDSVENAEKEIKLWFTPEEICSWMKLKERWMRNLTLNIGLKKLNHKIKPLDLKGTRYQTMQKFKN